MASLLFDGATTYIEVPNSTDFSVSTTGGLTVAASLRPDVLDFPNTEGSGYVHWLGVGEPQQQEWTFRIYDLHDTTVPPRPNRISFYVFNLAGGLGVGSYFQDRLTAGAWINVVGTADGQQTCIYRDGVLRKSDVYAGQITPAHGTAPLRIGTRDFSSFFLGSIRQVRLWNRALSADEVTALAGGSVPADGLVAEYLLGSDVAYDSSPTLAHNGTIVDGTWSAS
ncbi:MAG: LamG domain-containing protein [Vulcanimicrobiaceae bacterium]